MACRSCYGRQLGLLGRQANILTEVQGAVTVAAVAAAITRTTARQLPHHTSPSQRSLQTRRFGSTPRNTAKFKDRLKERFTEVVGRVFRKQMQPYRVIYATETIFEACAKEANYKTDPVAVSAETIPTTEEGEHIGEGGGMWHDDFKLPATFSTWSQVTMLHMYMVFARVRNLEPEMASLFQRQLVDHFFFDAEDRMASSHGLSSRMVRHRYLKDLFVQWRGAIVAYDEGIARGDAVLAAAIWRNIFKGRPDVDFRVLAAIVSWMRLCFKMLDQFPDQVLFGKAQIVFKWPAKNELRLVDVPARELEDVLPAPLTLPSSLQAANLKPSQRQPAPPSAQEKAQEKAAQ